MNYGLFIQDSPASGEAFVSAARFASAAIARGHVIRQIFLYGDAVLAVSQPMPTGLLGLGRLAELATRHQIPLLACQSAIERLGIAGDTGSPIAVGSLGQWFDASYEVDRVMSFVA